MNLLDGCICREKKLWAALSYLFVDTEVDFQQIVKAVKGYSMSEIEFALFKRVAPVCVSNMLSPAPSVWWYFNEDELIADIEALIGIRAAQGSVGRCMSIIKGWLIRVCCLQVWRELKAEIRSSERGK